MSGDHLLLRPTAIGGDTAPDDYQVIWNGMLIGRILKQPGVPLGRPNWFWGVAFPGRPQPSGHRGQRPRGVQAAVQGSRAGIQAGLSEADIEAARGILDAADRRTVKWRGPKR